ncbi:DUF3265 domain-containing protein [Pseudoalteromonas sp. Angola-31]|nr:DUF3265 domain-containing protein [Pseudoalteromonas sp. 3J6]MDC9523741.1 DUF3265 domain-containing protein [Pseudoalteromonas sp. Angola-31]
MASKFFKNDSHAWHFYYALVLVVKVVCGSIGIAVKMLSFGEEARKFQRTMLKFLMSRSKGQKTDNF